MDLFLMKQYGEPRLGSILGKKNEVWQCQTDCGTNVCGQCPSHHHSRHNHLRAPATRVWSSFSEVWKDEVSRQERSLKQVAMRALIHLELCYIGCRGLRQWLRVDEKMRRWEKWMMDKRKKNCTVVVVAKAHSGTVVSLRSESVANMSNFNPWLSCTSTTKLR